MTADTTDDTTPDMTVYPIGRPERGGDDRFTIGLVLDLAAVLTRHGYPPITTGADLLRVQQALFTLIYQEKP
jgi:hypothetical protein